MADTIFVRSTLKGTADGGHRVVLHERDDAHPDGEVMIAGPEPMEVGLTGAVRARIARGELELVAADGEAVQEAKAKRQRRQAAPTDPTGSTPGGQDPNAQPNPAVTT